MADFIAIDEIQSYIDKTVEEKLNSTIGTGTAKTLDKIIDEKLSTITNKLNTLSSDTEKVRTATGTTATLGSIDETGSSSTRYYTVLFKGIAPITGLYTINGSSRGTLASIYKIRKEKSSYYYNKYSAGNSFEIETISDIADEIFRQTIKNSNEIFYMYAQAGEPIILLLDYGSNTGLQDGSIKYKK